jgi:hypothetical protein
VPERCDSCADEEPDCAAGAVPGVEAVRVREMGAHIGESGE